jgi:hypothetical protein
MGNRNVELGTGPGTGNWGIDVCWFGFGLDWDLVDVTFELFMHLR